MAKLSGVVLWRPEELALAGHLPGTDKSRHALTIAASFLEPGDTIEVTGFANDAIVGVANELGLNIVTVEGTEGTHVYLNKSKPQEGNPIR